MNKWIANSLSMACPLFKPGVPYLRENTIYPIWTNSHFIAYDVDRRSPLWVYCRLDKSNLATAIDRKDTFAAGDYTLSDDMVTSAKSYELHNRMFPTLPFDRGHQIGSQFRRASELEQLDVDVLAGCCPETPELNRHVKAPLETAIRDRAAEATETYLCAGPVFTNANPSRLNGRQVIPDYVFLSAFMRHGAELEHSTFLMANVRDQASEKPESVSLDSLQNISGLVLWDCVRGAGFRRDRVADWYV